MEVFQRLNKLIETLEVKVGEKVKSSEIPESLESNLNNKPKFTKSLDKIDHIIAYLETNCKNGKFLTNKTNHLYQIFIL